MSDRYDVMYDAARRHFVEGDTMEAIAHDLCLSRSTVSRMLARARSEGIVVVSLAEPRGSRSPAARHVSETFGVRVHVVDVESDASPAARLDAVGARAAELLGAAVRDHARVGVAWGITTSAVARALEPQRRRGVRIVQMNGAVNASASGLPYVGAILQAFADAFGGEVVAFPVPAFFDDPRTRDLMWRERSVASVLDEIAQLDVALFGVGAIAGRVPSRVYAAGYLTYDELAQAVREGAVGDVCTVVLDEVGGSERIGLNQRATGPTPAALRRIPRRIAVVGDPTRARALLAALRAQVATDLVCDDATLRELSYLVR